MLNFIHWIPENFPYGTPYRFLAIKATVEACGKVYLQSSGRGIITCTRGEEDI